MEGQGHTVYHDFKVLVPRADEQAPVGVAKKITTATGNLYLLRVPIAKAIAQDFPERVFLDLDITKELRIAINLPDPYRFQLRPLGVPSGVRIYGLTLERAPLQMEMTATEAGNVFNEPQVPTFRMKLHNKLSQHWVPYNIETVATSDDGIVTKQIITNAFRPVAWVYGNPVTHCTVSVPVPRRGLYELKLSLVAYGSVVSTRETTFALLAQDTRKYRDESPFGTWDFGGVHATPSDPDVRGPLYVKAGLRYGMGDQPEAVRRQYGLLPGGDPRIRGTNDTQAILTQMKENPDMAAPTRFLVFHESGVSGPHLTRTPDLFTGRPPYKMSPDEEKTWKALWEEAENATRAIRSTFPKAEIYFGNTVPHMLEEFLRRGWPPKDIGTIGNESGCFDRPPETQPTDFISGNACMWMLRQIADHYGAKDTPMRQCLEICYPNTNPGNLTERTQAAYLVRHVMHSLAWGVPVIRPMCLSDMGNSYYYSNWGAAGLCHAWPNVSPKFAYVSFATMTLMLDGAKLSRSIPTGSTVVYAQEFRNKDKKYITCFWTLRGTRPVTVEVSGKAVRLTGMMGREQEIPVKDHAAAFEISSEICYLVSDKPVAGITLGAPVNEGMPTGKTFLISGLDRVAEWTVETNKSVELEMYNFLNPRRKGNFEYREVGIDGGRKTIEVKPRLPVEGSEYLQMYSVLVRTNAVEIPGEPTEIGVMVNGNGGWGRLIFEIEDAGGQRWISIGAEQAGTPNPWMADWLKPEEFAKLNQKSMNVNDWNCDDAWGRSFINHDGWRFVRFPMPGQYPGDGYHWPKNSQWRFSGDGVVKYPLKFKKLVITMPEKILYMTDYIPVPKPEIQLRDLMVTYDPVEKVFAGE